MPVKPKSDEALLACRRRWGFFYVMQIDYGRHGFFMAGVLFFLLQVKRDFCHQGHGPTSKAQGHMDALLGMFLSICLNKMHNFLKGVLMTEKGIGEGWEMSRRNMSRT
ncbi:hypothetical protein [uncultured Bilophila sp.]|uniref:hypothetical protein n=1 Tax=uncultured Bilophila sp. TaxID=529385 RepID=UPI00280A73A5|nr:hypothetical protein [uncultured Bilophila sp.]